VSDLSPLPVVPTLATIADEIAHVRGLLLRYEKAREAVLRAEPAPVSDLQGFDLGLQMLADLEVLTRQIARCLPDALQTDGPPSLGKLRLERSRRLLGAGPPMLQPSVPKTAHDVDLF
jgi:hypothetical protein